MSDPNIWVVSDGAAGNELPALALANALGRAPPRVLRLRARWPWQHLAPQWAPVVPATAWLPELLCAPWPELAIGAGRTGAAALLSIARASGGRARTLQILDPRIAPSKFDLVIAPAHDRLRDPNVLSIEGSLHAIDDACLQRERAADSALGALPSPRLILLIGGPRRGVGFGRDEIERLAAVVARWRRETAGSVILIGSRRTPAPWAESLREAVPEPARVWFSPVDGTNPFRGALAWGDVFVVTADSVNMQSEALGTGRPVYSLGKASGKLGAFQNTLIESGRLRALEQSIESWNYEPLRELARILPAVRKHLKWSDLPR